MKTRMQPRLWIAIASLLLLSVTACGDEGNSPATAGDEVTRGISVSGTGQASITPDTVMATLGVTIVQPDLESAQSEAATRMDAVIASLIEHGVAEEDIQTATFAINLQRDYSKTEQPVTGYQVIHTVTIKVREIDRAGEVIQAAVDAGANNVQNVWFALEDAATATDEARELAVNNARDKATELARLAGVDLGQVMSVSETTSSSTPQYDGSRESGADAEEGAVEPPISPGQANVYVTVTMTWSIE